MNSFDPFRIDEDATTRGLRAARRDREAGRYPSFEEMAAELRPRRSLSRWSGFGGWRRLFPPAKEPAYLGPDGGAAGSRRSAEDDIPEMGWHLRRVGVPRADGYRVEVELIGASGAPVAGVVVDLALPGDPVPRQVATGADGLATFTGVPEAALDGAQVRLASVGVGGEVTSSVVGEAAVVATKRS